MSNLIKFKIVLSTLIIDFVFLFPSNYYNPLLALPKDALNPYKFPSPVFTDLEKDPIYFNQNKFILKSYGPLVVDINNIVTKDSNLILPAVNLSGKPLFLAISCSKLKINVKTQLNWKGWIDSTSSFETNLLNDLCN